jgi:hypothetical protein
MGLPLLFADSLRIGSTIILPYRVLFGRIFLLVGMIIHGAMRSASRPEATGAALREAGLRSHAYSYPTCGLRTYLLSTVLMTLLTPAFVGSAGSFLASIGSL